MASSSRAMAGDSGPEWMGAAWSKGFCPLGMFLQKEIKEMNDRRIRNHPRRQNGELEKERNKRTKGEKQRKSNSILDRECA